MLFCMPSLGSLIVNCLMLIVAVPTIARVSSLSVNSMK